MKKLDLSSFEMKDAWFAPFLYRKANENFADFFSGNGYYPYDGDYNTNIRVNLKVFLDENGRVNDMSYYKVYDMTQGHGKPVTRDADLTPFDEKKLASALSQCTESTAEEELEKLLSQVMDEKLPGRWTIKKVTKRSVTFCDKIGNEFPISRSRITKAIDISHAYIEILTKKEFWQANPRILKIEDADPLLALFSKVDASTYYNYEHLQDEAESRLIRAETSSQLERINLASESGDLKALQKELRNTSPGSLQPDDLIQALYNAIIRKDVAMAQYLLKHGADVNRPYWVDGKYHGIMYIVINSGLDPVFALCLKSGINPKSTWNQSLVAQSFWLNRPDYAFKLLDIGIPFLVIGETAKCLTPENIKKLLKYKDIVSWDATALDVLYQAGEIALVKRVLTQLNQGYYRYADTVKWIMGTGDIKLMNIYAEQGYPYVSQWTSFNLTNTSCYSSKWTRFYRVGVLFKDEHSYNIFLTLSISECIKHQDCKGLYYLFDELHAIPDDKQIVSIISLLKTGDNYSKKLLFNLIENVRFEDDGEWHGSSGFSQEEQHNIKVKHSAALPLLVFVLESDNAEMIKLAIDDQANLFLEPAAFLSIYKASTHISDPKLQRTIHQLIQPAAETIVETWGTPKRFVGMFPADIQKAIDRAVELIGSLS